jgi:hypothetical protein
MATSHSNVTHVFLWAVLDSNEIPPDYVDVSILRVISMDQFNFFGRDWPHIDCIIHTTREPEPFYCIGVYDHKKQHRVWVCFKMFNEFVWMLERIQRSSLMSYFSVNYTVKDELFDRISSIFPDGYVEKRKELQSFYKTK